MVSAGASVAGGAGTAVAVAEKQPSTATTLPHAVRRFNYDRDIEDLREICANVYGGTDYMPRLVKKLSEDPGVLVLAAEAVAPAAEGEEMGGSEVGVGRIDGIICGERRGECIWLFGLRVREGIRGKGMGHFLMEAICSRSQVELTCNAHPPGVAPPDFGPLPPPLPAGAHAVAHTDTCHTQPPSSSCSTTPEPITSIVTCTTSYNPAAQRIIGRQLTGPLYEVEGWPAHKPLDDYEAAVGWVRGRGVPAGAPNMLDWIPGARAALESDAAALALLPRWRRVSDVSELRAAVSHLLYGSSSGSSTTNGCSNGSSNRALEPLLWLPMPYDAFPITGPFVTRELAAGNVWLLTAPSSSPAAPASAAGAAAGECSDGMEEQEQQVVGVMLLTYFEMLNRVSAGILARDNAATHAAMLHAGSLHPHFMAFTLRDAARAPPPTAQHTAQLHGTGASATAAAGAGAGAMPMPALYEATGGYRDHWVYGKRV
ncbi:hypothetical protein HYH02_013917 [Chlamydomonas schloesseri]|uniref:N-acetyltransferase domain-containing protein n=1 Tax=Chlamydomonas schloesseri TaxID=2026947 RepID=A0A835T1R6_9CHLO|nr:hypothetical protein HYH02_013917 [Chlamydomonas schloesseri]|eukprot:KAG2429966.1 hypothetical protein HYH02_013917 [Chlamydomonas schloesseri]